jgi:uncharacterized protein YqeY
MSLAERLSSDYKEALKAGHGSSVSVLRMVRAAIKNAEIEKGTALSDEEIQEILGSFVKRGRESVEHYLKASREDLVQQERQEMEVIQQYLPQQLSGGELADLIGLTIREIEAQGPGDFGKVMKAVMAKVRGRADGKVVHEQVKRSLEV